MTAILIALALLLLPAAARGEEGPPVDTASPSDAAEPGDAAPAPTASQLGASTLAPDISSASYYELAAWCRSLGLDESGSRAELQQRLARHLNTELPAAVEAAARTVTVRSARESRYFTVSDIDEKYVTLSGDVVVEVRDGESGALHAIHAARILYNQSLGIVTAEGGVTYELTRSGKTERFEGASLSFDLNTSEAVFYDGRSSKTSTRNGTALTYFFQGNTISRLANDTVVMESGSFSSCDIPEDPHYQIRATKVWILAPGEWAIQNAVLQVGRVPLLYLPVFFWPGDRVFFNPALGYREREGTYVQTTTYLIGKREKEQDNPLSFLKLEETGTSDYELELHGMFLRKIPTTAPRDDKGRFLKLMLDGYSRLGVFLGAAGSFPPLATFTAGIGVSRSLFGDSTSNSSSTAWTQFWGADSVWNTASLFGVTVPFRFGFEGDLKQTSGPATISARFEYFSDPSFTSDFYARTEGLALTDVLETSAADSDTVAKKTTLSWDVTSRLDFSRLLGLPAGTSLSIPTLNAKVAWLSKDDPDLVLDAAHPAVYLQPEYWDPGKTFYYPSSIIFPTTSLSLSGDLLKLDLSAKGAAAPGSAPAAPGSAPAAPESAPAAPESAPAAPESVPAAPESAPTGQDLRPPFPTEEAAPTGLEGGQLAVHAPERRADIPISGETGRSSLTISYQVQPRVNLEHTLDSRSWNKKEDVDGSILYRTVETGGTASMTATAALLDRLAELSVGMTAEGNYRLRFDPADVTPTNWADLVLGDYQQDRFALRSSLAATIRPLLSIPEMAGSSISYKLGWRLYQLAFTGSVAAPEFTPTLFSWSASTVPEHSLQSAFQLAAFGQTDTLSLSFQLPPLDTILTGQLAFGIADWKTRVQGGVREVTGVMQAQPLTLSVSTLLGGALTASQELLFLTDPTSPTLDRAITQLSGWGASVSFTADRQLPVSWDGASFQWKTTSTDKVLLPSAARLAYVTQGSPLWLWKDRVRLEGSASTAWNLNIQRFTDSSFDFSLTAGVKVSQFLDFSFASVSSNSKTYRYIPGWAEAVGETWVNPLTDLVDSFNFWDISDRYRSGFKIRTLSIKAVHHLHDWDLSFEYQGSPQLRLLTSGLRQYEWTPTFSISVQWVPVPEVKSRIHQDTTGLSLRG